MPEYLTEENLNKELIKIYPNTIFIRDKKVPNSNIEGYPDFRNEDLKIIVEFDGDRHYTQSKVIKKDELKNKTYSSLGYKVIRIPYFVQLNTKVIANVFNIKLNFQQKYPQGFIDIKALLPSDFCELGIEKFQLDLEKFYYLKKEIVGSLKVKIEKLDIETVLPKSLYYLLNCS
jgi:hypothetical protein